MSVAHIILSNREVRVHPSVDGRTLQAVSASDTQEQTTINRVVKKIVMAESTHTFIAESSGPGLYAAMGEAGHYLRPHFENTKRSRWMFFDFRPWSPRLAPRLLWLIPLRPQSAEQL